MSQKAPPEEVLEETLMQDVTSGQFFFRNAQSILMGIAVFIVGLILMNSFSTSSKVNAEHDYMIAAAESDRLEGVGVESNKAYALLQDVLLRRSELHPRYDGLLVQAMLLRGELDLAKDYTDLVLARVDDEIRVLYGEYSNTSLVIYDNLLNEALSESKELQLKLAQFKSQHEAEVLPLLDVLYAYNLLRLAFLEGEVGTPEAELYAWDQVLKVLHPDAFADSGSRRVHMRSILANFKEGSVDLLDYIKNREAQLRS